MPALPSGTLAMPCYLFTVYRKQVYTGTSKAAIRADGMTILFTLMVPIIAFYIATVSSKYLSFPPHRHCVVLLLKSFFFLLTLLTKFYSKIRGGPLDMHERALKAHPFTSPHSLLSV